MSDVTCILLQIDEVDPPLVRSTVWRGALGKTPSPLTASPIALTDSNLDSESGDPNTTASSENPSAETKREMAKRFR